MLNSKSKKWLISNAERIRNNAERFFKEDESADPTERQWMDHGLFRVKKSPQSKSIPKRVNMEISILALVLSSQIRGNDIRFNQIFQELHEKGFSIRVTKLTNAIKKLHQQNILRFCQGFSEGGFFDNEVKFTRETEYILLNPSTKSVDIQDRKSSKIKPLPVHLHVNALCQNLYDLGELLCRESDGDWGPFRLSKRSSTEKSGKKSIWLGLNTKF